MTSPTEAPANVAAFTAMRGGRSCVNDFEQLAIPAGLGWLGVAIAGVWEMAGGAWPYLLFAITLMLAAALSVAVAWSDIRETDRATLRRCGLGIGLLAVASTVVAWALPLWMTLLAITFAVWAVAAPRAAAGTRNTGGCTTRRHGRNDRRDHRRGRRAGQLRRLSVRLRRGTPRHRSRVGPRPCRSRSYGVQLRARLR